MNRSNDDDQEHGLSSEILMEGMIDAYYDISFMYERKIFIFLKISQGNK